MPRGICTVCSHPNDEDIDKDLTNAHLTLREIVLAAVIERRLSDRMPGCSLIFHRKGKRVGDFYTSWARALARAEVKPFTIHDLRRTAVRNMLRAGVDRATAKAISGHTTDSMLERYNIQVERDLSDGLAKRAAYEDSLPRSEPRSTFGRISKRG